MFSNLKIIPNAIKESHNHLVSMISETPYYIFKYQDGFIYRYLLNSTYECVSVLIHDISKDYSYIVVKSEFIINGIDSEYSGINIQILSTSNLLKLKLKILNIY